MKSLTRTLLIVAGALIGTGFVLALVGFAIGGFSWNALNTAGPYDEKSQSYNAAEVSGITVDAKGCDVVLVGTDADEIKITYYENKNGTWNLEKSADGKLSAEYQSSRDWFNLSFGLTTGERAITIAVPAKYAGTIEAVAASGDVDASKLQLAKELTLSSASGSLKLTDVSANGKIAADAKSGDIDAKNISANNDLDLTASSGSVTLTSGRITGNLTMLANSGDLKVTQTNADGKISLGAQSGGVSVKALSGNDIDLEAGSGDVRGSIIGKATDFTITANANSGDQNIGNSTGGSKHLNVSTNSGDIEIEFDASVQ